MRRTVISTFVLLISLFLIWATGPSIQASGVTTVTDRQVGRRIALLIGIGDYRSASFPKLDYPANDVARLAELLESPRYGFSVHQVTDKTEVKPTRDNILAAIRRYMIEEAKDGDVLFFYYSGHGSSVRNSLSDEPDKRDETIIPLDAVRPVTTASALKDIRDKELAELFNRSLDKKVFLTTVFDSCHSGSITRSSDGSKEVTAVDADIRTAPKGRYQTEKPEDRGALVITAAEDYQQASGGTYTLNGKEARYSHLTANLISTLYTNPGDALSAELLFQKVTAQIKAQTVSQTPTLAGIPDRLEKSIFGTDVENSGRRIRVAAATQEEGFRSVKFLQGGLADGIADGMEFRRIDPETGKETSSQLKIKVERAGLTRSSYVTVSGTGEISDGDIFEQTTWSTGLSSRFSVWIPSATLTKDQLDGVLKEVALLERDASLETVKEPTREQVVNVIERVDENNSEKWMLTLTNGKTVSLGPVLMADSVKRALGGGKGANNKLFINLPPTRELKQSLEKSIGEVSTQLSLAVSRDKADYILMGRKDGERVAYAWVVRSALSQDNAVVKSALGGAARRPEVSMPAVTDWISGNDEEAGANEAGTLEKLALKLVKIGGFLRLQSPIAVGSGRFPYKLAIQETLTKKRLGPNDILRAGTSYDFVLRLVPSALKRADAEPIPTFHAYLLNIDADGNGTRVAQLAVGGSSNISFDPSDPVAEIPLKERVELSPDGTFGTEVLMLIVTDKPLQNSASLNFSGVKNLSLDRRRDGTPTLQSLLTEMGGAGAVRNASLDTWLIQHLVMRSVK